MPPRRYNQIEKAITVLDNSVVLEILSSDREILSVFRRAERIVAAVYLVSEYLSDREPLRREIREAATLFGRHILSVRDQGSRHGCCLDRVRLSAARLISLLDLATIADLLSQPSVLLLRQEVQALLAVLESRISKDITPEGHPLSRSFFEKTEIERPSKGHQSVTDSVRYRDDKKARSSVRKDQVSSLADKRQFSKTRMLYDGRRDKILALIREMGSASVTDISEVIRDCSSKSIQRILVDLTQTGSLKTVGERRWRRYSAPRQKS